MVRLRGERGCYHYVIAAGDHFEPVFGSKNSVHERINFAGRGNISRGFGKRN